MSRIRSIVVAVSLGLIAGAASANADMAKAKNCTA